MILRAAAKTVAMVVAAVEKPAAAAARAFATSISPQQLAALTVTRIHSNGARRRRQSKSGSRSSIESFARCRWSFRAHERARSVWLVWRVEDPRVDGHNHARLVGDLWVIAWRKIRARELSFPNSPMANVIRSRRGRVTRVVTQLA